MGIVPHYVDKRHPWLAQYEADPRVLLIDVQSATLPFIDQIKQCHHIVSSSLHGIICADAYGIPATWVEFSDGVIGGGFKFRDYFASIGRTAHSPARIGEASRSGHFLMRTCPIQSISILTRCTGLARFGENDPDWWDAG